MNKLSVMSQKSQSDGGQKHFAVGRGLLAAAETLNFSMSEQRSGRQMGGGASGVGVGSGMDNQDGGSQIPRRGGGNHIGNTMKLFASLGLSPSDLDALAEIPEEDISVETLPHILMQLKSRKGDASERRGAAAVSSDGGYRGGRDSWDGGNTERMGGPSLGPGSARVQTSADFGYGSLQDGAPSRGYGLSYGSGGGSRERPYSELSRHDSYSGVGIGPSASDPNFRQRRMGSPSNGKVQDFLGVMPPMFPHVCSLCDFDVHSNMVSTPASCLLLLVTPQHVFCFFIVAQKFSPGHLFLLHLEYSHITGRLSPEGVSIPDQSAALYTMTLLLSWDS